MDRALQPDSLRTALPGASVRVQSLGYGDRVLEERALAVPDRALGQLKRALGDSRAGFDRLVRGLRYRGEVDLDGARSDRVSGRLAPDLLARAATRTGTTGAIPPGLSTGSLERSLSGAGFDLYADRADGRLERLDLTLALDDPDNALPPTRIRFSLTGGSSQTPR